MWHVQEMHSNSLSALRLVPTTDLIPGAPPQQYFYSDDVQEFTIDSQFAQHAVCSVPVVPSDDWATVFGLPRETVIIASVGFRSGKVCG